jgi:glycosyltransferase involved in cell wall biosynthesis
MNNEERAIRTDGSCELSIVMPCLNESETLERCIQKARSFLNKNRIQGEIIVADNGSRDGSPEIARRAGVCVVDVPIRGYGAALLGGITSARGKYVIMGDADDSYDFSDLMPFLQKLRDGFELVMGDRFAGGIKPGAMPFLHRYLGNPILSFLGRLFFKSKIRDFHCGLRGFNREAILSLDLHTTGMEFASEMVVKASLYGLNIAQVPTILYPDGRSHPPHLRTWSDGWRHLRFLLLYSPRWLFLYPGIVAVVFGLAVYLWLLPGSRRVGSINLDINTLLYASLLVLVGVQAILFAFLTKIFGISEGFLPPDRGADRLLQIFSLERGFLMGVVFIGLGLASSVAALLYWESQAFGSLNPSISMRLAIPGVVLFAVGFQIVLSSLFLSILTMQRR